MTDDRPLLRNFLADNNLTPKQLADLLAARGIKTSRGTIVTPNLVSGYSSKYMQIPQAWLDGLDGQVIRQSDEPAWSDPDEERPEQAPRRPSEAKVTLPEVTGGGKKRIAGAYKFAGAALAAGSGCEGVAIVWGDQADAIADLWIQAAEDNPWAARFVNVMQAGGSVGDLAAAHLYMMGATLYVLGAGIPGGDVLWPKYTKHRIVPGHTAESTNGAAPESEQPASDDAAAASTVADS